VDGNPGATAVTAPAKNFLPEPSIVKGENPSEGDFVMVVRKEVNPSPVNTAAVANTRNKLRTALTGVGS
jgi:hypothetical protein